jgi:hypothetical protein
MMRSSALHVMWWRHMFLAMRFVLRRTAALSVAAALCLCASAQAQDSMSVPSGKFWQDAPAGKPVAAKPVPQGSQLQPCPEYGAGFMRQPGSATCFRFGGSVGAEQQFRDRRSGLGDASRPAVDARLNLESRTQTPYGPLRAVVGVRGALPRD